MKYLFVINPKAGQKKGLHLKEVLHRKISWNKDIVFKVIAPHSTPELEKKVREEMEHENFSHVIAVGGDGTIKNILKALIYFENTKLGIIPSGTGNVLAANLGISKNMDSALNTIFHGKEKIIDIGLVNKKPFAVVAGVGLPTRIVESATRKEKMTFGHWAYFLHGIKELYLAKEHFFEIEIDGKQITTKASAIFISNAVNFLSPFSPLAPQGSIDDGYLDVLIFKLKSLREDFFGYLSFFVKYLRKNLENEDKLQYFKAKNVKINSHEIMKVQADGAIVSQTPAEIEILPGKLKVMV